MQVRSLVSQLGEIYDWGGVVGCLCCGLLVVVVVAVVIYMRVERRMAGEMH